MTKEEFSFAMLDGLEDKEKCVTWDLDGNFFA